MTVRTIVSLVAVLFVVPSVAMAQATSTETIREKLLAAMTVDVRPATGAAVEQVFRVPVFRVVLSLFPGDVYADQLSADVYEKGEGFGHVFEPTSSEPLPFLMDLIDPAFRLTEATAPVFRAALVAIMREGFFETAPTPIVSKAGEWQFITGTFFDDLSGFVVAVDADGTVTSARYVLGIKPSAP